MRKRLRSPLWFVLATIAISAFATIDRAWYRPLPTGPEWVTQSDRLPEFFVSKPKRFAQIYPIDTVQVPGWHGLYYKHDLKEAGSEPEYIDVHLQVPPYGVADIHLGYQDSTGYFFRVSRVPAVPSGLYRLESMRTVAQHEIESSSIQGKKATHSVPIRLSRTGKVYVAAYHVRVERDKDRVRALVNGASVAELALEGRPWKGGAGVRAPQRGWVGVTKVELGRTTDPAVLLIEDFRYRPDRVGILLNAILRSAGQALGLWLIATLLTWACIRREILPTVRSVAKGFLPVAFLNLLFGSSHPQEAWIFSILALAITYFVLLIRHRERIRWSGMSHEPGLSVRCLPTRLRRALIGYAVLAVAVPVTLLLIGKVPALGRWQPHNEAQWAENRALKMGSPLLPKGEFAHFSFQSEVTLDPESTLEFFFRMKTRRKISDWYALRLSTASGSGFVKSFGEERSLAFHEPLDAHVPYKIEVRVQGNQAVARLNGSDWDRFDVGALRTGSVGLVPRLGRAKIQNTSIITERDPSLLDRRLVRAGLIGLLMLAAPLVAIAISAGMSRFMRIPWIPMLTLQLLLVALLYTCVAMAWGESKPVRFDRRFYPLMVVCLAILMNIIYLIPFAKVARFYATVILLFFGGLAVAGELAVRASPLALSWNGNWQGGYIRDQFLIRPQILHTVWPSYLRRPTLAGRRFPLQKKPDVTRILSLGGSTTLNACWCRSRNGSSGS